MPDSMHVIDAGLPKGRDDADLTERVDAIENYLYMLIDELRYLLRNLSMQENVNSASLEQYTESVTNPADDSDSIPRDMKARTLTAEKVVATASMSTPSLSASSLSANSIFADIEYARITPGLALLLNGAVYGDTLPAYPMNGRIFFKRAT